MHCLAEITIMLTLWIYFECFGNRMIHVWINFCSIPHILEVCFSYTYVYVCLDLHYVDNSWTNRRLDKKFPRVYFLIKIDRNISHKISFQIHFVLNYLHHLGLGNTSLVWIVWWPEAIKTLSDSQWTGIENACESELGFTRHLHVASSFSRSLEGKQIWRCGSHLKFPIRKNMLREQFTWFE